MVCDSVGFLEAKACAIVMAAGYLVSCIHADAPCEGLAVDLRIAASLHSEINEMVVEFDEEVIG